MIYYSQEEILKLFDLLPTELKLVILSNETTTKIRNVCERYEIADDLIPWFAILINYILIGLLPPTEFLEVLITDWGFDKKTAENIFRDVYRFILSEVKSYLNEFYPEIKLVPGGKILTEKSFSEKKEEIKEIKKEIEEKKISEIKPEDIYREPI